MRWSCFPIALLLAVAVGSRLSLAASENSSAGGLGSELRELAARAGGFLVSSAGRAAGAADDVWRHGAAATGVDAIVRPLMRRSASPAAAGRKRLRKAAASANCIPAAMCRKRKVLCGKRCYRTRSGLTHVSSSSSKCVVKCKKCVPTC